MVSEATATAINRITQLREAASKRAHLALKATNNARLQAMKDVFSSAPSHHQRRRASSECSTETFSSSEELPHHHQVSKAAKRHREADDGIALVAAARRRDALRTLKEKSHSLPLSRLEEVVRAKDATIAKVGVISVDYRLQSDDDDDKVIQEGNKGKPVSSPQQLKKNTPNKKTPNRKPPTGKGK